MKMYTAKQLEKMSIEEVEKIENKAWAYFRMTSAVLKFKKVTQ